MAKLALHWQIAIGMIVGAFVGLALNWNVGSRITEVTAEPDDEHGWKITRTVGDQSTVRLQPNDPGFRKLRFEDSPNLVNIVITAADAEPRRLVVDGTRRTQGSFATLDKLQSADEPAWKLFQKYGRSSARWAGDLAQRFGKLFLRMLQMVAVPLIATSLISGVMGLGHAGRLGKMFSRTLLYYVVTSMLAITTGLLMVNLYRPGLRGMIGQENAREDPHVSKELSEVMFEQLETMIPSNPIGAFAGSDFLSIISFSLAFAIFAILVGGKTAEMVRDIANAGFEVMMSMTMTIIKLAPVGVMLLMLYVTATQGKDVFWSLSWYMLAVLSALAFHAIVILPAILFFVAKRNPWEFARAMSPALLTAFSSASSNGTLPLTLASVEERAGVSNRVSSFVLPLGATINMDGTALYEAVAVLFIAQLYHGHNLALDQQLIVAFTALLASVGAAGIPHAGLVMMVIILQAVGLPVEMQGIIIAVDRVLDMCRTSVNVWSDSCGCAVIARLEVGSSHADDDTDMPLEDQP